MPHSPEPILWMKNIHVSYDTCKALRGVDFDLYPGEIHGLVGEHRAGKSTLVKLLGGAVHKHAGEIIFKGTPIESFTPQSAMQHKIGIIYQDLTILPTLNAVENIFSGRPLTSWWGGVKSRQMRMVAERTFTRLGITLDLTVPLELLSEAEQHMVELARVLTFEPEILIFDEMSSKLTPDEMEVIYRLLVECKQQGRSVIYISHNMDEIFTFADRVTILQHGYKLDTEDVRDLDKIKLMKLTYSFVLSREELEHDNRELYLLKKYNEYIIRNLPEGIIILDPEEQFYLINYAAIRIFGLDERDLSHQRLRSIFYQDVTEHADAILAKIQAHEACTWDELEYGSEKILKLHVLPFKDENYKFLGTILIIEDISKERYLQEYLLRAQKIASIAELAAGVAHEINNPLGIIKNYVTLLKAPDSEAERQDNLAKVENELARIVSIIDNLLSFSNLKKLPMKRVNLALVLDDVVELLNHRFKQKQLQIHWTMPPEDVPILGDENRLKQVVINLLMNSIEAVMDHGVIELALDMHGEEGYVEMSVTDNGVGIPEEIQQKIFDPFFSTKAGKKNSGLGLSICQHIIESHQGLITCTSGNTTTTFNIRLPLLEPVEWESDCSTHA